MCIFLDQGLLFWKDTLSVSWNLGGIDVVETSQLIKADASWNSSTLQSNAVPSAVGLIRPPCRMHLSHLIRVNTRTLPHLYIQLGYHPHLTTEAEKFCGERSLRGTAVHFSLSLWASLWPTSDGLPLTPKICSFLRH